jgi:hypothetical protein
MRKYAVSYKAEILTSIDFHSLNRKNRSHENLGSDVVSRLYSIVQTIGVIWYVFKTEGV